MVGSGIAGLLTARVLADHFGEVTVLEQDRIGVDTEYHRGVPQARHPHALLARGGSIIEELFPGLRAELADLGAPVFDFGESSAILYPGGFAPRCVIGIPGQAFTRVALERCVRRRVLAREEVVLRSGFRVEGLCCDTAARRVTGVRGRASVTETIEADLVVDASGQTSRLPRWLVEAGFPAVAERTVDGGASYASRLFDVPGSAAADWTILLEPPLSPTHRGGGISAVEAGRWLAVLIGVEGEMPPSDEREFLAYAQSLRHPLIGASLAGARPAGPVYRTTGLSNRWRLYHRMPRWPRRLLCLGDAVCRLNPIYGQGMTVAAVQALTLQGLLARHGADSALDALARVFQRRVARSLLVPWLMAVGNDLKGDACRSGRARLAHWYVDRLLSLIPDDADVYRRFMRAAQMVSSPATLLHPRVVWRVAACGLSTPRR
ncbi:FAD-dependent oxidoreductase [Streptomyces sp. NPDC053048]|uniref:FAD-dependent oxidoreductase n=1 Tax=Streptomyces sp. NPDC053048 TaxID=3365694 RepID=UPI0037D3B94F